MEIEPIKKIEIKDGLFVEEAEDLKSFVDMVFSKGLIYLKFINEKGLMPEFEEWRKKKLLEVI